MYRPSKVVHVVTLSTPHQAHLHSLPLLCCPEFVINTTAVLVCWLGKLLKASNRATLDKLLDHEHWVFPDRHSDGLRVSSFVQTQHGPDVCVLKARPQAALCHAFGKLFCIQYGRGVRLSGTALEDVQVLLQAVSYSKVASTT